MAAGSIRVLDFPFFFQNLNGSPLLLSGRPKKRAAASALYCFISRL
ncbi:hypothetical protein B4096_1153 [Heyndrickxia coagulans]|nr:hypothetical protein B4096_1153 [Heyndrickxia coagulans]